MYTKNTDTEEKNTVESLKKLIFDFNELLKKQVEFFSYGVKTESKLTVKIIIAITLSAIAAYTGFVFLGVFLLLLFSAFASPVISALIVTGLYVSSSIILLLMAKKYFGQIKRCNNSIKNQIFTTMENTKKWLLDLR